MPLVFCAASAAAGLPIGMNMFCLLPTVSNGDWLTFIGDVPWLMGDENDGVADRELPRDTARIGRLGI